jgi:purine-binding chemotaxis protein CheW
MAEITAAALAEAPPIGMRWRPEYVRCVAKQGNDFIIVLDLHALFTASRPKEAAADGPKPVALAAAS